MDKKDWLREEIVKLEGMKVLEMQIEPKGEFTRNIFESMTIEQIRTVQYKLADVNNKALQTIIDRYQAELNQPTNNQTL